MDEWANYHHAFFFICLFVFLFKKEGQVRGKKESKIKLKPCRGQYCLKSDKATCIY